MEISESGQSIPLPRSAAAAERVRARLQMRRIRKALLALALLAVAALVVFALRAKPVPADFAVVTRGPLTVEVRETGQTRVKDRYVVSAPVTGHLLRLALEPNDTLEEGAPLAQLAPSSAPLLDTRARAEAQARLAAALSALEHADVQRTIGQTAREQAERELGRARELERAGSIERRALEQAEFLARTRASEAASAEFARKIAAEQVRLARAALAPPGSAAASVDVSAPVSGSVLRVFQKSAGVVSAGTPLCELGDLSALEVVVDLLTTDAVQVRPGTPVVIEGWGGEHGLAGRVRKVELAAFTKLSALGVDEQRANVLIVLDAPRASWATLGDGYRVEVRLEIWQGREVVKVPQSALFRRGDSWAVFRVLDGEARYTEVQLGHRSDSEAEVTAGLRPGALVIIDPSERIDEGVRVAVRSR